MPACSCRGCAIGVAVVVVRSVAVAAGMLLEVRGRVLVLPALSAASDEDEDGTQQQADHRRQTSPHADIIFGVVAAAVFVDVILDNAEDGEHDSHNDNVDNPREQRNEDADDAAEKATKSENGRDEGEATGDWGKDEGIGQAVGAARRGEIEVGTVDLAHDVCDLVANLLFAAPVLIGLNRRNVKRTVAECTERQRRVTDVGLVGERDLHDGNVSDHRCRDGRDKQENGRDQDQESADAMKPPEHRGGWY